MIRYIRNADKHGFFPLKQMEQCSFLFEVLSIFPYFERLVRTVALSLSGSKLNERFAVQIDFLQKGIWNQWEWNSFKDRLWWAKDQDPGFENDMLAQFNRA